MSRLPKQSVGISQYTVHVSGFAAKKDIGLVDVIKRAIFAIGFQPCDGCERRGAKPMACFFSSTSQVELLFYTG